MSLPGPRMADGSQNAKSFEDVSSALIDLYYEEHAQGLVEYVLILALIAFTAVAGMSNVASSINSAFSKVGTYLGNYIS